MFSSISDRVYRTSRIIVSRGSYGCSRRLQYCFTFGSHGDIRFDHRSAGNHSKGLDILRSPVILVRCHTKGGIEMGKAVKINITLPEEELTRIDKFVKTKGSTRSGLILEALHSYIQRAEQEAAKRARLLSIEKASSDIRKLRKKSGKWDGVAEIRKWRDAK